VGIQTASSLDQHLSQIGVDAPVALLIGMRQGIARNLAAKSDMDRVSTPSCAGRLRYGADSRGR
jgi:hypothetical protein